MMMMMPHDSGPFGIVVVYSFLSKLLLVLMYGVDLPVAAFLLLRFLFLLLHLLLLLPCSVDYGDDDDDDDETETSAGVGGAGIDA